MPRPRDIRIEWHPLYQRCAQVRDRELQLGLTILDHKEGTIAIAVECPSNVKTAADVFNSHAHHVIGEFSSIELAERAAALYANEWLAGRKSAQRCECPPIAQSKPGWVRLSDQGDADPMFQPVAIPLRQIHPRSWLRDRT